MRRRKLEKAKAIRGPKLFLAAAPCPTGWEFDPAKTNDYVCLQVETGLLPLKKAVGDSPVVHAFVPEKRRPVEDYLRGQGRFHHLFEPMRQKAAIARIHADVDRYWGQTPTA